MDSIKIFTDDDVRLKIDMATATQLMRDAFVQISKRSASVPVRTALDSVDKSGRVLFMPAYSPSYHLFGLKMVSVFKKKKKKNLPSIHGKMLVMDDEQGIPKGLIDAEYLTALRTGAASGVATDLLALKEAKVLAIFGTGAQAKTQVAAIIQVRAISEILVFGTYAEKSEQFCDYIRDNYQIECKPGKVSIDLKRADIICTATTSTDPVFSFDDIKAGVHINGIGSYKPTIREIPEKVIQQCLLVVDQKEAALSEAGDITIPINNGTITEEHIHAELGEIIDGSKKGRTEANQITVFKSVGNAVQDLAMASFLLK